MRPRVCGSGLCPGQTSRGPGASASACVALGGGGRNHPVLGAIGMPPTLGGSHGGSGRTEGLAKPFGATVALRPLDFVSGPAAVVQRPGAEHHVTGPGLLMPKQPSTVGPKSPPSGRHQHCRRPARCRIQGPAASDAVLQHGQATTPLSLRHAPVSWFTSAGKTRRTTPPREDRGFLAGFPSWVSANT